MRSLPARPALLLGAPAGGRQINSKDTQTAGSVVSKSQAANRHRTLSQSKLSPVLPVEGATPASTRRWANRSAVYWA
jgi:hypothetical protein